MLAVLGGIGAALCWASATITATRASRLAGSQRVVGWVMIIGFAVALPLVLVSGVPRGLDARQVGWLALSGVGNVGGLLCAYAALRIGKISIVTPVTSTEGAIAAVFAVLEGERLGGATAVLLVLIAIGVLAAGSGETADAPGAHPTRATVLAIVAAFMFGASLFATGRVSQALPISWALLPPRLVGVIAVSIPLLARRQLRIERPAVPFVVVAGLSEIAGSTCFALSSRHGIAVAAILGSQFATLAVVASYFLFHERLRRLQVVGVVAVLACVATLTAVRA